jgi:inhibitor of cysteine peptidase
MRSFLAPVFALVVLASGAGCADIAEDDTGSSLDELRSLTIQQADDGKTFTVEKGQSFKVSLSTNSGNGYQWKVVSTTRKLGYPTPREGVVSSSGGGGPSAGGTRQHVFTWNTNSELLTPSATAHAVKLEYRRPFEGDDVAAARTFTFKIKIKAGTVAPAPEAAEPIVLFEEHNGSEISAIDGQDLKIRLPENPSAGYRWHILDDGNLTAPADTFEVANPGRVGGGGTRILTWETAGKVGAHAITLKYSRGANGAASKTYEVFLDVKPATADTGYECPTAGRTLNCMPPTNGKAYCKRDFRTWAEANCDVSYLD